MDEHLATRDRARAAADRRWLKAGVAVDIVMMSLLIANLLLLVFDTFFRNEWGRGLLASAVPRFHDFYARAIHANFALIDLSFIGVYLVELGVRWTVAVRRRTYASWYVYPLVHWYDVLGLVPLSGMRFVRLLRAGVILVRLHRLGLIDLRRSWIYRLAMRWRAILTEEVSDRVVLRVLGGIQREIGSGSPIVERLWQRVVAPRKELVLHALADQLELVARQLAEQRRPQIRAYVDALLADAFTRKNMLPLESVPVMGNILAQQIEQATRRVVQSVIERVLDEAYKVNGRALLDQVGRTALERLPVQDALLAASVREMAIEALEVIKDQVRIQQWRIEPQPPDDETPAPGAAAREVRPPREARPRRAIAGAAEG